MPIMTPIEPSTPPPSHEMRLPFPTEKIVQQLQRVMDSDEFHATESQRRLLEYVVRKTIAGETDQIKGYTIATRNRQIQKQMIKAINLKIKTD